MVLIEAAARGISLISSNCPVGLEEIVNNQNGFIYNLMDQTKLVKIFTDIVDKEIKISSISNVRKSVEKFSYQEYFKRVYDSLCNN